MLERIIPFVAKGRQPGIHRRQNIALAIIIDFIQVSQAIGREINIGLKAANAKSEGEGADQDQARKK